ncbi:MAG: hypothetical protein AAGN82_29330 [Myxococcota bacterium]
MQRRLMRLYGLPHDLPDVTPFVRPCGDRERVLVRQHDDELELSVELPRRVLDGEVSGVDDFCQVVEGVSHFVLIVERARRRLATSQLELELQAELDKFLLLAGLDLAPATRRRFVWSHRRVFGDAVFRHPEGTERGDRYRLAHRLAARWCWRLGRTHLAPPAAARRSPARGVSVGALRAFYHAGPSAKVAHAEAA